MKAKTAKRKPAKVRTQREVDTFEATAKRLECNPDMGKFLKVLGNIAKPTKDGK